MGNDNNSQGEAGEALGGAPDPEDVENRAEGRPPEERSSEDPLAQAETILQESENRLSEAAEGSVLE